MQVFVSPPERNGLQVDGGQQILVPAPSAPRLLFRDHPALGFFRNIDQCDSRPRRHSGSRLHRNARNPEDTGAVPNLGHKGKGLPFSHQGPDNGFQRGPRAIGEITGDIVDGAQPIRIGAQQRADRRADIAQHRSASGRTIRDHPDHADMRHLQCRITPVESRRERIPLCTQGVETPPVQYPGDDQGDGGREQKRQNHRHKRIHGDADGEIIHRFLVYRMRGRTHDGQGKGRHEQNPEAERISSHASQSTRAATLAQVKTPAAYRLFPNRNP